MFIFLAEPNIVYMYRVTLAGHINARDNVYILLHSKKVALNKDRGDN